MGFPLYFSLLLFMTFPKDTTKDSNNLMGRGGIQSRNTWGWFSDWVDLEEVDHDDVKVRLFTQSLVGEARKWFKNILDNSILNYQAFEYSFKEKWEDNKNPKQYLSQYHSMRRRESESIQEFSNRFMKTYNVIPAQFKPPLVLPSSNMLNPLILSSPCC